MTRFVTCSCTGALVTVASRNRKVAWFFSWSMLLPSTNKKEECIFQTESFSSCKVQNVVRNMLFKADGSFNTVNTFGRRLVGKVGLDAKTYGNLYLKVQSFARATWQHIGHTDRHLPSQCVSTPVYTPTLKVSTHTQTLTSVWASLFIRRCTHPSTSKPGHPVLKTLTRVFIAPLPTAPGAARAAGGRVGGAGTCTTALWRQLDALRRARALVAQRPRN